jgi:hypothetical protein
MSARITSRHEQWLAFIVYPIIRKLKSVTYHYRSGPLKLQLFLSPSLEEWRGKTSNFMRPEQ